MSLDYGTCALCPRLCRPVCPVAVGSAREAATPTAMMTGPFLHGLGHLDAARAADLASLCVSCGACTTFCRLSRPVGDLLRQARGALIQAPAPAPLGEVEGEGALIAVECDGRPWGAALAARLGQPVARLRTADHLGEALLDHPAAFALAAQALVARAAGRTLVVADRGCLDVAVAAGVAVQHLASLAPPPGEAPVVPTCAGPALEGAIAPDALACCGACAPLLTRHPQIAQEVAESAARRLSGRSVRAADARCGAALRAAGATVSDPVTALVGP